MLIVGGGVAGMQAAITAAERGHKVTLIEKTEKLGGILNFTDYDTCKTDLNNFKNLLVRETEMAAQVLYHTELTAEVIAQVQPDAVLVAIGSSEQILPVPGREKLMPVLDVFTEQPQIGQNVIIIGGGNSGCETGIFLAKQGKHVTVLEMGERISPACMGCYRNAMMEEMDKQQVRYQTKIRCTSVTEHGVEAVNADGQKLFYEADTVINACGMKANPADEIQKLCGLIPMQLIGDCAHVGKVGDAVEAGFLAAMKIV